MKSTALKWHRMGKISLTQGSTDVTGFDTNWEFAGIKTGDALMIDGYPLLEIAEVNSDISITLEKAFTGESAENIEYAIIRNFQATLQAEIAARLASLLDKYERYIDEDLNQIRGESAYEIAVKKGFQGTEEEWLDSLRGGPAGPKGDAGADGLNGADGKDGKDGAAGKSAYELAVEAGFEGTLEEWLESLHGRDGKSAYELAVANGFYGSLREWLMSLQAEPHRQFIPVAMPPAPPCDKPKPPEKDDTITAVVDGGLIIGQ